jgi:hypothetical protein
LFHSKEQQARKRNNNCSVQRNSRRAKGTTIVSFKGTTSAQKEQQFFLSKEQQARKRNNKHARGRTIVPFKSSEFVETWYVFCLNSRLIPHQLISFMSWFISKLSNGWFFNVINFIIIAQLLLLNHDTFISLQKTGYG